MKNKIKIWFEAIRPRTLSLSLSGSLMGSFIAMSEKSFSVYVMIFSAITAVLLQIVSNLANDYGDYFKNITETKRVGPVRPIHTMEINIDQLKRAIILTIVLSLVSGSILIFIGTKGLSLFNKLFYFLLGFFAIFSALKYTLGKKPFGYIGLGDLMVFIFFGFVSVIGTYYLHTHNFEFDIFLPASSIGFLSTGVLNINNMRDYGNDLESRKFTFAVLIGKKNAKLYHVFLIVSAVLTGLIYTLINFRSTYQWLFLLSLPLLFENILIVLRFTNPLELNKQLKKLSLTTIFYSISFGLGLII